MQKCIIDANGYYVDYVVTEEVNTDGEIKEICNGYILKSGESLLEVVPPIQTYLRNKWDNKGWVVDMSDEEAEQATKDYYNSLGIEYPLIDLPVIPQEPDNNTTDELQAQVIDDLIMKIFELEMRLDAQGG